RRSTPVRHDGVFDQRSGCPDPPGEPFFQTLANVVDAGYLTTLPIPLRAGRDFNADDRDGAGRVVIVGERAAKTFWADAPIESAVGKSIQIAPGREMAGPSMSAAPLPEMVSLLVVGVAADFKWP